MIKKIIQAGEESILWKEVPFPRPPSLLPRDIHCAISRAPFLKAFTRVCMRVCAYVHASIWMCASPFLLFNGKNFYIFVVHLFFTQKYILEIVIYQYVGNLTLLLFSWLFKAWYFMVPSQFI